MRFTPKSEEEIQSMSLIQPGIYDNVWDINGRSYTVYDYLMDAIAYKLRHFSQVGNILDKYELGSIEASDCIGVSGKVEIIIQKGQQKPDGGFYFDKNSVKDYITVLDNTSFNRQEIKEDEIPFSDEIPF